MLFFHLGRYAHVKVLVVGVLSYIGARLLEPSLLLFASRTRYTDSVSQDQLLGSTSTSGIDDCSPLIYNGTLVLHPCGLIANTLFNDIFTVTSGQTMLETDIAWDSDVSDKVKSAVVFFGRKFQEVLLHRCRIWRHSSCY